MIPAFIPLGPQEIELMHKAPILVSILIAGADGHIDRNEIRKAIAITSKKLQKSKTQMVSFYAEVSEDFEDKLKIFLQEFPQKESDRARLIIDQLKQINPILEKLDRVFAREFYNSLKEIAKSVANSSGGLLGISRINDKEAQYLNLEMIKLPAP
jgi:hypothetical protein